MAQVSFINDPTFALFLSEVNSWYPEIVEKALFEGAEVIADRMEANLKGELGPRATGKLLRSFGITPVRQNREDNWNLHIGFGGYREPGNVPFQLIARSFESGAVTGTRFKEDWNEDRTRLLKRKKKETSEMEYWRKPTRFASKAVKAKRAEAEARMKETAEEMLRKSIMRQW